MSISETARIDADRDSYRKFYDTELSKLLSAIWEGSLHMGLFQHQDEPLADAQLHTKDYIARAAALKPGQHVIEAACGAGATAIHLARNHGVRVHATNISQAQLAEAEDCTRAAGLLDKITFGFADYHQLGGSSSTYDCWWCQEALLYATDRERVLSEARRVVKKGGRILFTDLTLSQALPENQRSAFASDIRAPHLWSVNDYERLLTDMKFSVLDRQDWSAHVAPTFAAVARNLSTMRESFAAGMDEEVVRGTEFRIGRQLDMARAGHLGWCFYALEA
jgi:sarcosine/dimethylglycine N-methyltransferase